MSLCLLYIGCTLIISIQAGYDLWVLFWNVEYGTWKETGVVFSATPSAPTPQVPTPTPTSPTECALTRKDLITAVKGCEKSTNETSCPIDIRSKRLPTSASSSSNNGD
jgi:hypothetical protein